MTKRFSQKPAVEQFEAYQAFTAAMIEKAQELGFIERKRGPMRKGAAPKRGNGKATEVQPESQLGR